MKSEKHLLLALFREKFETKSARDGLSEILPERRDRDLPHGHSRYRDIAKNDFNSLSNGGILA